MKSRISHLSPAHRWGVVVAAAFATVIVACLPIGAISGTPASSTNAAPAKQVEQRSHMGLGYQPPIDGFVVVVPCVHGRPCELVQHARPTSDSARVGTPIRKILLIKVACSVANKSGRWFRLTPKHGSGFISARLVYRITSERPKPC